MPASVAADHVARLALLAGTAAGGGEEILWRTACDAEAESPRRTVAVLALGALRSGRGRAFLSDLVDSGAPDLAALAAVALAAAGDLPAARGADRADGRLAVELPGVAGEVRLSASPAGVTGPVRRLLDGSTALDASVRRALVSVVVASAADPDVGRWLAQRVRDPSRTGAEHAEIARALAEASSVAGRGPIVADLLASREAPVLTAALAALGGPDQLSDLERATVNRRLDDLAGRHPDPAVRRQAAGAVARTWPERVLAQLSDPRRPAAELADWIAAAPQVEAGRRARTIELLERISRESPDLQVRVEAGSLALAWQNEPPRTPGVRRYRSR
jgi:hypothetical protein